MKYYESRVWGPTWVPYHLPEVGAAATQNVFVSIELHPIDFDDHITQLALQTELVENGAGHGTHFSLHEAALELWGGARRLLGFTHTCCSSYANSDTDKHNSILTVLEVIKLLLLCVEVVLKWNEGFWQCSSLEILEPLIVASLQKNAKECILVFICGWCMTTNIKLLNLNFDIDLLNNQVIAALVFQLWFIAPLVPQTLMNTLFWCIKQGTEKLISLVDILNVCSH